MEETQVQQKEAVAIEPEVVIKPEDVLRAGPDGKIIIPKSYEMNLRARALLLIKARNNATLRAYLKAACQDDVLFFFNFFLWTLDPRKTPPDLPFITWDYEDDLILWIKNLIETQKDGHIEKSKDMGVTFSALGTILWFWLYRDSFLAHLGSRSQDDVDRTGDPKSLFEKLRYMLNKLPFWMLPNGFQQERHSMFMRLINPEKKSVITGESSNPHFSRGGRYNCIALDEFAFMEYGNEIWTATADASPCRIALSTPNGTGNKFWELRFKDLLIAKKNLHWSKHPEKSKGSYKDANNKLRSPWYDAECSRRKPSEVAQELDIDYITSGNPYFDLMKVNAQKEYQPKIGIITQIDGKYEFRENPNGWLRLFEYPDRDNQYACALDPAEGLSGGDKSTGACRNKRTRNLVAGIYGSYNTDQLADYGYLLSKFYNNALVCSEAGGYGFGVNKRLYDRGANVFRMVDLKTGSPHATDKLGFITNSTTRDNMLADMEAEIRENACELVDPILKMECMTFVNNDGKAQAAQGSTDDYIFAFAICGQLIRIKPYAKSSERRTFRGQYGPPPVNQGIKFKGG